MSDRQARSRKPIVFAVLGVVWLAFVMSDFAVLTGRKSMSYNGYANVRCSYWTGIGRLRIKLFGRVGSNDVNCPNALTNVEKW